MDFLVEREVPVTEDSRGSRANLAYVVRPGERAEMS